MNGIIGILVIVLNVFFWIIIVRFIMSWIDPANNLKFTRVLHDITEPLLAPIRTILPPIGMVDLSAMVALILLQVFTSLVSQMNF